MTNKEVKSFAFDTIKHYETKEMYRDEGGEEQVIEYFVFEGYASTFGNIDLDGDIIDAGAFDKFLATNEQISILWCHEMNIFSCQTHFS